MPQRVWRASPSRSVLDECSSGFSLSQRDRWQRKYFLVRRRWQLWHWFRRQQQGANHSQKAPFVFLLRLPCELSCHLGEAASDARATVQRTPVLDRLLKRFVGVWDGREDLCVENFTDAGAQRGALLKTVHNYMGPVIKIVTSEQLEPTAGHV